MARDKLHFPSKPDVDRMRANMTKAAEPYDTEPEFATTTPAKREKPDPFPETPAAITLEDIAAEFGPEASIRGNTNLGIYEIVTPTAVHAIDRDKVAKLKSKAELRAYVDDLKAHGKA